MAKLNNVAIENAEICFRNFTGKEGKFNSEGNRNFSVLINSDVAKGLEADGWNIRWLTPKDESDAPQAFMQVKVAFGQYPPKIVLVSNGKKSEITEEQVYILDWAEIDTVDLIIRPYQYNVNGKEGIKAYLKTMYVVLTTDDFANKYETTPDAPKDCIGGCGDCSTCTGDCSKSDHL